ncbi:hypothetical protein SCAR479_01884 [Seiridium cardinale]|uniref:Uncharacterized protein n=1 Tax=Seiridium cardinale TaxID=138064 RepID=A0ABR2Y3N7_9PEZI
MHVGAPIHDFEDDDLAIPMTGGFKSDFSRQRLGTLPKIWVAYDGHFTVYERPVPMSSSEEFEPMEAGLPYLDMALPLRAHTSLMPKTTLRKIHPITRESTK